MINNQINKLLEFANMQLAAEAFLIEGNEVNVPQGQYLTRLTRGNTHASRFTPLQAERFVNDFEVLAQYRNDPLQSVGTGFSGTLFKNRGTGELTLSFRSTEFIDDAVRDSKATNDLELRQLGWAFGQIAEMETWYAQLRQDSSLLGGKNFNVTGYSLGGHLATAFNILRREQEQRGIATNPVIATYTFNGAGVGGLKPGKELIDVIANFMQYRDAPDLMTNATWAALTVAERSQIVNQATDRANAIAAERTRVAGLSGVTFALDATEAPAGDQAAVQYQVAAILAGRDTVPVSNFPLPGGVNWIPYSPEYAAPAQRFANMTEIVGSDSGRLGLSFVSNSGVHYGTRQEIYIEDQPLTRGTYSLPTDLGFLVSNPSQNDFADTHSLVLVLDSLSLMAAMEALDPNLTPDAARYIFAAASRAAAATTFGTQGQAEGDTLERVLDSLGKLIVGPDAPQTVADYGTTLASNTWHTSALREPFHLNLKALRDKIGTSPQSLTLTSFAGISAAELSTRAQVANGLAYRYALKELNPFAVLGPDTLYAPHNASGELNLYDAASGTGGITSEWAAERAAMLAWKNVDFTADGKYALRAKVPLTYQYTDKTLKDANGNDLTFTVLGTQASSVTTPVKVIFGGEAGEVLVGGDVYLGDRLFGGGGDDVLQGNGGSDHLEGGAGADNLAGGADDDVLMGMQGADTLDGGAGHDKLDGGQGADTYIYRAGEGVDTIADGDGLGGIRFYTAVATFIDVSGGKKIVPNLWQSADEQLKFSLSTQAEGGDTLSIAGAGGTLLVTNFVNGNLGITLEDAPPPTPPTGGREIRGDWAPKEFIDPDTGQIEYHVDELGNVERDPGVLNTAGFEETDNSLDGSDVADHIVTGDYEEQVFAYAGEDAITGSDLWGSIFFGGEGNDWIEAGAYENHAADYFEFTLLGRTVKLGEDKLYGGAGNDRIFGEAEATLNALYDPLTVATNLPGDWASGGSGEDEVYGGAGDDVLQGGAGEDVLVGGAGMDVLLGDDDLQLRAEGNFWRVLHPNFGDNTAGFGGFEVGLFPVVNATLAFPDLVFDQTGDPDFAYYRTGGGADVLIGGAGRDILIGQAGEDTLYGGDDDDIAAGWEGADQIYGGEGNDLIAGDFGRYEQEDQRAPAVDGVQVARAGVFNANGAHGGAVDQAGNDYIDGGAGDDTAWGEGGDDVLMGREGNDTLYGDATYLPEELQGADLLDGGAGEDMLVAGGGNDRLFGGEGADTLDGGEGDDMLNGGTGNDVLLAGAGADTLLGGAGADQLTGGDGADRLEGGAGDDTLDGDEGDDIVFGDEGTDQIAGGAGNDTLYGGSGEDVIEGGEGNDTIDGGAGIDIVRGGAGDDTYVLDFGYGQDLIEDTQGQNRIQFGAGITPDLLSAEWSGSTLAVAFGLSGDTVSLDMAQAQLGGVDFGDGTAWTQKNFVNFAPRTVTQAAAGGGLLQGNAWSRNDLRGAEGDDEVRGASYDDLLAGGDGADTLDGAGGSDTYFFSGTETGIDILRDSDIAARAYLGWYYGDLGIVELTERGQHGGKYKATGEGEGGSFTAYFDTYEEAYENYSWATISYIEPLPSIAPLVRRDDAAALESLASAAVLAQDVVEFGAGVSRSDLTLTVTVGGADAEGHPEQPWYGGGTLAVRWAGGGFDLQVPGVNYGFTGTNLLAEGSDPEADAPGAWRGYRLGEGIEQFRFADGTTYSLEDVLRQASVEVRPAYAFLRGSGSQDIAASEGSVDFGDDIDVAEVSAQRDGEDLVFQLSDESAEGRIAGWYADPAAVPEMTFTFADGTVLDRDAVTRLGLTQYGTEGFDFLEADPDFASALYGLGGADILNGGAGNDLLDLGQGGVGESALTGQAGDDIYVYGAGYGLVNIDDEAEEGGDGFDTVRFGAGIAPQDVAVNRDYGSLTLTIGAGDDRLSVFAWLDAPGGSVERFEFADGTVWDGATVAAMLPAPDTATEDDDALYGTFGDDVIYGLGGNDEIAGFAGDDTLDGGDGDDYVEGSAGIDLISGGDGIDDLEDWEDAGLIDGGTGDDYVYEEGGKFVIGGAGDDWIDNYGDGTVVAYNPGDGDDTIYAFGGFLLSIGGGIGVADLSLDPDGDDLVLSVGATGSVRLTREFEADPQAWPEITLQLFGSVHTYDLTASIDGDIADFHLADSETAAFGGALAWQYATTGSLDALTDEQKRSVLADPGFGSATQPISLGGGNQAPALDSPIADQVADEDAAFGFTVPVDTFGDPEAGDVLTLTASLADGSALPGWLAFDAGTASFSGTPLQADVGALDIRVTATDTGGLSASDEFALTVANVNDAPVLANPVADQAATEDTAFSFTVPADTVSDEDPGDPIAWFAARADGGALPAWLSFDAVTRTLSGTPTNDDVGTVEIALAATDAGGLSASDTFAIAVANVNEAPMVANAPGEVFVTAGSPFAFALAADTFADPDAGDTLVYSALSHGGGPLPGWLAFDAATLGFSGTAAAADIGAWPVAVSATDGAGESVSAALNLAVRSTEGATVNGNSGDNILYGNTGDETLAGRGGDDYLAGYEGEDTLRGGGGNDVLQGGAGSDVLRAGNGHNLLDGGSGADLIYGGRDGGVIVGGTGNDVIRTGRGTDILAFNRGDGQDTVYSDRESNNTLSLGGGITYEDLRFRKSGKDLVLELGGSDSITFKHWYSGQGRTSLLNIQIVTEAMAGFDDAASDPMQGARVNVFDAAGLVQAFDAARAADPYLASWALSAALAQFHLWGNDTAAIGGDLAYHYGLRNGLAGMSLASAQAAIGAPGFGSDAQSLHPFSGLQEGLVKLS